MADSDLNHVIDYLHARLRAAPDDNLARDWRDLLEQLERGRPARKNGSHSGPLSISQHGKKS